MAYRSSASYGAMVPRASTYRRRYGNLNRRRYPSRRRSSSGGMGGLMNVKFLAGVGIGYVAPSIHPMQDMIITALAVLPVPKMGLGAPCRGYVIGRIARSMVPGLLGGFGSSGISSQSQGGFA